MCVCIEIKDDLYEKPLIWGWKSGFGILEGEYIGGMG